MSKPKRTPGDIAVDAADVLQRFSRVANVAIHRAANKLEGLTPRQAFARDVEALAQKHGLPMTVDELVGQDDPGVGVISAGPIPEEVYAAIERASTNTGFRISAILRLDPPAGPEN